MIESGREAFVDLMYFASAILLILSLKRLSTPRTARNGNLLAMIGMGLAIVATFFIEGVADAAVWIVLAMLIGGGAGYLAAKRVQMTEMPQMVAIFNGLGGATAALVSVGEFLNRDSVPGGEELSIVLGTFVGAITLTGSLVAFAKLQGLISGRPIVYPNQQLYNAAAFGAIVILGILVMVLGDGTVDKTLVVVLLLISLAIGVTLVLPIGGADMPVVIALLNAASGVGGALTGFTIDNQALIIAGALVGASGMFLSFLMARAMNRSLLNIVFGAFGQLPAASGGGGDSTAEALPVTSTTADDAAVTMGYASSVIIVPGYGLAVAQAQHAVRELADVLRDRGVNVRYAIHPVAGRMPGHMNVLLAEANVSYDDLYEMDRINDDFRNTDVVLVVGANDVVNPAASQDPGSPIYGMPVLRANEARNIIVLKRSMEPGFAGIQNMLFHDPKTSMLFGDAKDSINNLIGAVKNV
ncbi:MAG TPA: NAD(P)(+) transhydrogenase (Re/Si-specific) subunit beta [Thermomicrobiales bacterium]|nr:NAD(P)(+) transhydrogenase (Re/Si-specific) subunit beta [Thermomicrobiales bacterium]